MDNAESSKTGGDKYVEAETVFEDSEISSLSNFTDAVSEKVKTNCTNEVLIIEPFYGGSHKQLIDILEQHLNNNFSTERTCLFSLPAKKWHWRARTSALYFSQIIPKNDSYKVLFCSSVLNLAELIALRFDLSSLFKVIYFHENQLVYPVQKHKERDFQYGYNQILSSLVADVVVFNSHYNKNSFLENISKFLNLQPDFTAKNLHIKISPKCRVIYFPVEIPYFQKSKGDILHIIWPHRWEHDKNPVEFFTTLFKLKSNKIPFSLSVLGESFDEVPEIFTKAKEILKDEILQFGRVESKAEYYELLRSGHVVVSTAHHEFFGVAMLEAVLSGCFPLACNRLVYPEIYPSECLYNTSNQLYKKLKNLCEKPYLAQVYLNRVEINFEKLKVEVIMNDFKDLLFRDANPFVEGISKVKDLIQELEESFRESNNIGNNLVMRCVLLRAENQNLALKIDERKRNPSTTVYNKQWQFSLLSQGKSKALDKNLPGEQTKRITCRSQSRSSFNGDEIDILHKTIGDLQKKLRERDKKIELLCEKYLYLKNNKYKMENELKSKIMSLEKQLDLAYETLNEVQNEMEIKIGKNLSATENTYEALFLQEKLRCSKLMYEKIRLHHEIKRLEDSMRRQTIVAKGSNEHWDVVKCSSEPLMRHF